MIRCLGGGVGASVSLPHTIIMSSSDQSLDPPPIKLEFLAKDEDFTKMPDELANIDWSKPISWGKYAPYPPSEEVDDDINTSTLSSSTISKQQTSTSLPLPLTPVTTQI